VQRAPHCFECQVWTSEVQTPGSQSSSTICQVHQDDLQGVLILWRPHQREHSSFKRHFSFAEMSDMWMLRPHVKTGPMPREALPTERVGGGVSLQFHDHVRDGLLVAFRSQPNARRIGQREDTRRRHECSPSEIVRRTPAQRKARQGGSVPRLGASSTTASAAARSAIAARPSALGGWPRTAVVHLENAT
jgi:hypothetical protein